MDNKQSVPFSLVKVQNDEAKHEEIWNTFQTVIPKEHVSKITKLKIATDFQNGAISQISRDGPTLSSWEITIDPLDVYSRNYLEKRAINYIAIHQFGQMMFRDSTQVSVDDLLWELKRISSDRYHDWYPQKKLECGSNLMLPDGCAKTDSYINMFYQRFWMDIHAGSEQIAVIEDKTERLEKQEEFSKKYSDRFVTHYASTSVETDIAESWSAFVLQDKPISGNSFVQKINFFYEFPELVELREEIRNEI